jgi:RNA polymerase sigma-70 factor, ECF subfamily
MNAFHEPFQLMSPPQNRNDRAAPWLMDLTDTHPGRLSDRMLVESDDSLVTRAKAGDTDAFRVLVERHTRSVFRLAFRLTGSEPDADEVVQDSFVKAYRQLHRFESRASFSTWLYRITANCAVDLIRSRPRGHESLDAAAGPDSAPAGPSVPATTPSAERLVLSGEIQARMREALGGLSDRERTAFLLRHVEGLSIEEISQQLHLKTNATKHSIFRAVRKMRLALGPFVGA